MVLPMLMLQACISLVSSLQITQAYSQRLATLVLYREVDDLRIVKDILEAYGTIYTVRRFTTHRFSVAMSAGIKLWEKEMSRGTVCTLNLNLRNILTNKVVHSQAATVFPQLTTPDFHSIIVTSDNFNSGDWVNIRSYAQKFNVRLTCLHSNPTNVPGVLQVLSLRRQAT